MWDCLDEWNTTLPEGLPTRIMKKFQETRWCAVMVRKNFLDLRNNFRRNVDPAITTNLKDIRNKCLGWPTSCGKNIALAMLFHWARTEGWLDFLKYNETRLQQLPCQIFEPTPLGEGAGVGMMKGADTMELPEESTLYDLIQTGITHTDASVGVVVRLRKELSLVKVVPVLSAIDQYNSWFTLSVFQEPVTDRSCRSIYAKELTTVNVAQ
ncbi:uncharacterized protein C2845_PM03G23640 [Panicum miliaceum]|uniref:Small ribosomal subunit protein mS29 n=1 Tax=Panicum miliaceum TaxID=4540 RepID=A0A3L6T8J0_PANMI|nr:uncharacterized protein C2845_PM03G23640 [Panicum miliaceum]